MTLDELRATPLPDLPAALSAYLLQLPLGDLFDLLDQAERTLERRAVRAGKRPAPPAPPDSSAVMPSALRAEAMADAATA